MKKAYWIGGAFLGLWAAVMINVATLNFFGLLDPAPKTLIIDANKVVKIFIEERGNSFSDEQLKNAILVFDEIVTAQANRIHQETGNVIVNGNHILAGGQDVSVEFAQRVIEQWDLIQ